MRVYKTKAMKTPKLLVLIYSAVIFIPISQSNTRQIVVENENFRKRTVPLAFTLSYHNIKAIKLRLSALPLCADNSKTIIFIILLWSICNCEFTELALAEKLWFQYS